MEAEATWRAFGSFDEENAGEHRRLAAMTAEQRLDELATKWSSSRARDLADVEELLSIRRASRSSPGTT